MKYRITFGIGIGEDANRNPIDHGTRQTAIRDTIAYLSREFGGCFVATGKGGWVNEGGDCIIEPGISVSVVVDAGSPQVESAPIRLRATKAGIALRRRWNQTAVLVTIEPLAHSEMV